MELPPNTAVLAVGDLRRLTEMRSALQTGGLAAEILKPPGANANA